MNMNIGTLKVTCDHIEQVSPTKLGNDNFLTILLDDVDATGLMRQMVSMLEADDLLDYFSDKQLEDYLASRKTKLTPREQYDAGYNGE